MKNTFLLISIFILIACQNQPPKQEVIRTKSAFQLDLKQAEYLASLPIHCIQTEYPYKSHLIISKPEDLQLPIDHHPAFYGCFDWHSAVHGHWSLVYLLKSFPELSIQEKARKMLGENLTKENIEKELAYFTLNKNTASFERTYGWAWLLKLSEELYTWDDPDAKLWYQNLQPLTNYIMEAYISYLPKLVYPIRVGEHSNTAFGLSFAYDYAVTLGHTHFQNIIKTKAIEFYMTDVDCPITWEPSGYDFLSPCLQEIDIMRKVLTPAKFKTWISLFLPKLIDGTLKLVPGEVGDRSDGKLVHLDGLNFSRAWCLYPLSKDYPNLVGTADKHFGHSISKIVDGEYSGQHWLGSFALYALKMKTEYVQ